MSGEVLAWAMRPSTATGSNLKGGATGAGWLYALPRLSFRRAATLGLPNAASLAGLVVAADSVLVVVADQERRRTATAEVVAAGWGNVEVVVPADLSAAAAGLDLVYRAATTRGRWVAGAWSSLLQRLGEDGVAIADLRRRSAFKAARGGGPELVLRVTPRHGEARSLIPAGDRLTRAVVRRLGLEGAISRHPMLVPLEQPITRRVGVPARRIAVHASDPHARLADVPHYLREVAGRAGVELSGWRWGIVARGDYDSQKILMLLTPPDDSAPRCLVKLTRSARHADRLENEGRVLRELAASGVLLGRVPEHVFSGSHAGRAVLGQSLLAGEPFERRARWSANCPVLRDGLDALNEVAVATAVPVPADAVGAALLVLLDRYAAVYRPPESEVARLRECFDAVTRLPTTLPVVLQHGDPHPGNLLVSERGKVLLVDWESADLRGLPLWDSCYFFRGYATTASRRRGVRDRERAATRHLVSGSALGDRWVAALAGQAAALALPRAVVPALVYGCWVHRALKEATRLPPERLDRSLSVRLLRAMLADRGPGTLAKVLELGV
jgi:Phosphotransferase enzyme family